MIILTISFLLFSNSVFAYDYTYKDQYGRTVGYVDTKDNTTFIKDKFGRTKQTIKPDGTIVDKFGRVKGKIIKK